MRSNPANHVLNIMKNIIAKIKSAYPVSDESIRQLAACLTPMRFPKKHLLIQEGRFCQYAYFIETGMTRSFWIVEGEEITTSFAWEGSIVFSMDELYYHKKSEEYVETLEAVEAYRIRLDDLTRLLETNLELCNWGGSSTRTSTAACTAVTANGSPCPRKHATRSSSGSFPKCAGA